MADSALYVRVKADPGFEPTGRLRAALDELAAALADEEIDIELPAEVRDEIEADEEVVGFMTPSGLKIGALHTGAMNPVDMGFCIFRTGGGGGGGGSCGIDWSDEDDAPSSCGINLNT